MYFSTRCRVFYELVVYQIVEYIEPYAPSYTKYTAELGSFGRPLLLSSNDRLFTVLTQATGDTITVYTQGYFCDIQL